MRDIKNCRFTIMGGERCQVLVKHTLAPRLLHRLEPVVFDKEAVAVLALLDVRVGIMAAINETISAKATATGSAMACQCATAVEPIFAVEVLGKRGTAAWARQRENSFNDVLAHLGSAAVRFRQCADACHFIVNAPLHASFEFGGDALFR
jgi:hypothetical protein